MTTDPIRGVLDNRPGWDFSDLPALLIDCSCKKPPKQMDTIDMETTS